MSKSSSARRMRKQATKIAMKKAEALTRRLDELAGAFIKQTDLEPHKAKIVTENREGPDGQMQVEYWYEPKEEYVPVVRTDTHPDVQLMFSMMIALNLAYKDNNEEKVKEGFEAIDLFLERFQEDDEENGESDRVSEG